VPFLQAVEDQFHTGRDSKLIEDAKKVVAHDSGSTVLGFGSAFLALDFYGAHPTNEPHIALAVPLLMAALPLLDGTMTVLRRLRGGRSLLHGDRRHFYDLLLGINWSPRKVALTVYALTAAMCMIAWLALKYDFTHALLLCSASIGVLTIMAVRLGVLRSNDEPSPPFSAAQYRRF
jgi:UDP-GlcNAc:undecaprenyl-phosphate/decaprenyl-phosphate GlcNAc-1-phosphate transferase